MTPSFAARYSISRCKDSFLICGHVNTFARRPRSIFARFMTRSRFMRRVLPSGPNRVAVEKAPHHRRLCSLHCRKKSTSPSPQPPASIQLNRRSRCMPKRGFHILRTLVFYSNPTARETSRTRRLGGDFVSWLFPNPPINQRIFLGSGQCLCLDFPPVHYITPSRSDFFMKAGKFFTTAPARNSCALYDPIPFHCSECRI